MPIITDILNGESGSSVRNKLNTVKDLSFLDMPIDVNTPVFIFSQFTFATNAAYTTLDSGQSFVNLVGTTGVKTAINQGLQVNTVNNVVGLSTLPSVAVDFNGIITYEQGNPQDLSLLFWKDASNYIEIRITSVAIDIYKNIAGVLTLVNSAVLTAGNPSNRFQKLRFKLVINSTSYMRLNYDLPLLLGLQSIDLNTEATTFGPSSQITYFAIKQTNVSTSRQYLRSLTLSVR